MNLFTKKLLKKNSISLNFKGVNLAYIKTPNNESLKLNIIDNHVRINLAMKSIKLSKKKVPAFLLPATVVNKEKI